MVMNENGIAVGFNIDANNQAWSTNHYLCSW
jgi:hypothetical protein